MSNARQDEFLRAKDFRRVGRDPALDAQRAEQVFDLLMGTDVAPRKEFIVAGSYSIDRETIDA